MPTDAVIRNTLPPVIKDVFVDRTYYFSDTDDNVIVPPPDPDRALVMNVPINSNYIPLL